MQWTPWRFRNSAYSHTGKPPINFPTPITSATITPSTPETQPNCPRPPPPETTMLHPPEASPVTADTNWLLKITWIREPNPRRIILIRRRTFITCRISCRNRPGRNLVGVKSVRIQAMRWRILRKEVSTFGLIGIGSIRLNYWKTPTLHQLLDRERASLTVTYPPKDNGASLIETNLITWKMSQKSNPNHKRLSLSDNKATSRKENDRKS